MPLIIVESPTKSKTIEKFLGKGYKVLSSFGHVRDLPKTELGVDTEHDFKPKYVTPLKARKVINELKKELEKTDETILATDEDREGEAIAWHLAEVLKLKDPKRIVFHEITKQAIEESLKFPRKLDQRLIDSQQARRILDRIVGYKLSPFLWKKIARGLSAGRVQSVAVRLIAEREKEIEEFKPIEYWSISALFKKGFLAQLKQEIKNKEESNKIIKDLKGAEYIVSKVEKKESKKYPLPPFTTSTLQQESWKRFKYPAKFTMSLAQQLYEKGFITYHRTDSVSLSESSILSAKNFIDRNFGENYFIHRKYKTKSKGAQEAHEAIRPSYAELVPEGLDTKQMKLYDLIHRRFVASQMKEAIFDATSIDIKANNYLFKANGQVLKFEGFLKAYTLKFKEETLPDLVIEERLDLQELLESQHFTEPPARFNEATLIKVLEENGIGRPSTYAPIISTIQERNYIQKNEQKRFFPTEIGRAVNDLLVKHFPEVVDINFTAKMELELDQIAEGEKNIPEVCKDFYLPFIKNLQEKYKEVQKKDITEKPTDKICPECKSPLLIRLGRFGEFYACSNFPKCKYTESLEKKTLGINCPECKKGELIEKRTKRAKIFYACNRYPECKFALWDKPQNITCETCGSLMVITKRNIERCSSKDCKSNKIVKK